MKRGGLGLQQLVGRRRLLTGASASLLLAAVDGCSIDGFGARQKSPMPGALPLAALRAGTDRITQITVCTRPFRAAGPRIETEQVGRQTVVHNYGHGGSGWSLSWGSSAIAVEKAMAGGEREIAVIGCGALGLTSALLLQRAGVRVTIYAKELPPNVRSSFASGLWTPDSRICLGENATPAFKQTWAAMARRSFQTYQSFLGLAGSPVEFIDNYFVSDQSAKLSREAESSDARPKFAELQDELIPELVTRGEKFLPGSHPLGQHYLRRKSLMMFNISSYARLLMGDFMTYGGKLEIAEFHSAGDLAKLRERVLINATGYGARALFGDESVVPVRGQLARVIPQPEVNYGLFYKNVSFLPRRDGLVFQVVGENDYYGFNDDTTVPDRKEAELAVNTIAGLYKPT